MNPNTLIRALGHRADGRPIFPIRGAAPTPLELLTRACDTTPPAEAGASPLEIMQARASMLLDARMAVLDAISREGRAPLASEKRIMDRSDVVLAEITERINELKAAARSEELMAGHRALTGVPGVQRAHVTEQPIYHRGAGSPSFMRDMISARRGDFEASQRLARNEAQVRESRALTTTAGAGGEFSPPDWMIDKFVALARPGRVFADRMTKDVLPSGVSSINIPKVLTGTTTAVQAAQNASVSDTDITTGSVSSAIVTIAGKQVVSQQLIDQSGIPFDEIILGDLASDYGMQLDLQAISGSGSSGQLEGAYTYFAASGTVNTTYTQATPAVAGKSGFYSIVNQAISAVSSARFLPPDCIVMHPRRWSWVAAAFDGNNRPLVSPSGNAYNQIADAGSVTAQGLVGQMAGLPVYVDPNIPIDTGSGTDQDPVFVGRFADLLLWETPIVTATFDAPYADSLGILFRCHGYSSAQPARYKTALSIINGTGLVTPAY